MAELLDCQADFDSVVSIFSQNFSNNQEEIYAAIAKKRFKKYDYRLRFLFGLKESNVQSNTETIVAAAICIPRTLGRRKTLEIVWFATDETIRGEGFGSRLFSDILQFSKRNNYSGVLCTSTNKAASWWLSRPLYMKEINVCKYVLRAEDRISITDVSFTDNPGENEHYLDIITSVQRDLGIMFKPFPDDRSLECLYSDKALRSRKGKLLKGQTFTGRPYRYGVKESNHIWFLNDIDLITKIGAISTQNTK